MNWMMKGARQMNRTLLGVPRLVLAASLIAASTSGCESLIGIEDTVVVTLDAAPADAAADAGPGVVDAVPADANLCGNGKVDVEAGEECDDGNATDNDACPTTCIAAHCGDAFVWAGEEDCDNGYGNSATCDYDCTVPSCDDEILNRPAGEECEDGNTSNNDGCSSTCVLEQGNSPGWCGDGVLDTFEGCDDGNNVDFDGCSANCQSETCGDGTVQAHEQCDAGANRFNSPTCDPDCTFNICGDGLVNDLAGEECDGGGDGGGGRCSLSCLIASTCSDGNHGNLEQCDDGGTVDGDGCNSFCRVELVCGNGLREPMNGEQCDDFNTISGDGCDANCQLE